MLSLHKPDSAQRLVFEQDFAKLTDIDESVWRFNDGPVYNNELEKYTKKSARNAWIEDGSLVIEARKEGDQVTSARLESKKTWMYGRMDIVAKVPGGRGTWPAVWLLNDKIHAKDPAKRLDWPLCGEIDIMENVGYDPARYHFTVHSEKYNHMHNNSRGHNVLADETTPQFHTYTLEWKPNHIEMLMDGKQTFSLDKTETSLEAWPFDDHYFMILNLAIGGDWGGQKGVDSTIYPSRFYIKSIRVYQ